MLPQGTAYRRTEDFSVEYAQHAGRVLLPSRLARLRAWIQANSLERALIAGAEPSDSPELAARASQLTSARTRAQIAAGLERLVLASEGPQRRWWAASQREPLRANVSTFGELASLFRADTPLYARGIAIVSRLLSDGSGPLYCGCGERIAHELETARKALGG